MYTSLVYFPPILLLIPRYIVLVERRQEMEVVVYHIGNESALMVCIPETAMIHCMALARD